MNAGDNGRPNNLKLKIPSKTGGTIYKRDYQKSMDGSPPMKTTQDRYLPKKTLNSKFISYVVDFILVHTWVLHTFNYDGSGLGDNLHFHPSPNP